MLRRWKICEKTPANMTEAFGPSGYEDELLEIVHKSAILMRSGGYAWQSDRANGGKLEEQKES
jgi:hypothetical protein